MCGIFGVIQDQPVPREKLLRISRILRHRGPDDEGFLLLNSREFGQFSHRETIPGLNLPDVLTDDGRVFNIAFLHRRLAIIDLSVTGHQPMSYDDHGLWIVYNGEIYNYLELKKELEECGYRFATRSDAEVILASYLAWGPACVTRFNGMWAFAIWDRRSRRLLMSRDRFGIKPMFYSRRPDSFIFCSEIKGIREYLDGRLSLDQGQINRFCLLGSMGEGGSEQTIYPDVRQLPPGHILYHQNGLTRLERYWDLPLTENKNSPADNILLFRELFRQSIEIRLRSDVEVGSCLSGGMDSSSIVSFGTQTFNRSFSTFSVIWPGENCDESYYIRKVNEMHGCNGHLIEPDLSDLLSLIDREIWHQEVALPGPSLIAQWFVMEKAKEAGIKVLLDGQGGDETLSGYPRYLITYIRELMSRWKYLDLIKFYPGLRKIGFRPKSFFSLLVNRGRVSRKPFLPVRDSLQTELLAAESSDPQLYDFLPRLLKDEIEKFCLPDLLHWEDRNSMAHSVETRLPFLDYRLAEFSVNIPTEQKIFGPVTKVVLREAMKEYLPPEVYRRRDKVGFETPIEKLITANRHGLYNEIWSYLDRSDLWDLGILDKSRLKTTQHKALNFAVYSLARFIEMWS